MSPRKGNSAAKRATRSRIESTGESYTEARRQVVDTTHESVIAPQAILRRFRELDLKVFHAMFNQRVTISTTPYVQHTDEGIIQYPGGDQEVTVSMVITGEGTRKKVYMVSESDYLTMEGMVEGLIFYIKGSNEEIASKLNILLTDHRESGLFDGWLYGRSASTDGERGDEEINGTHLQVSDVRLLNFMMEQLEPRTKRVPSDASYQPSQYDYQTDLEYYKALAEHAQYQVKALEPEPHRLGMTDAEFYGGLADAVHDEPENEGYIKTANSEFNTALNGGFRYGDLTVLLQDDWVESITPMLAIDNGVHLSIRVPLDYLLNYNGSTDTDADLIVVEMTRDEYRKHGTDIDRCTMNLRRADYSVALLVTNTLEEEPDSMTRNTALYQSAGIILYIESVDGIFTARRLKNRYGTTESIALDSFSRARKES